MFVNILIIIFQFHLNGDIDIMAQYYTEGLLSPAKVITIPSGHHVREFSSQSRSTLDFGGKLFHVATSQVDLLFIRQLPKIDFKIQAFPIWQLLGGRKVIKCLPCLPEGLNSYGVKGLFPN